MKTVKFLIYIFLLAFAAGCAPLDEIYSHEFGTGHYRFIKTDITPIRVYLNKEDDSLTIYPINNPGRSAVPDWSKGEGVQLSSVKPGNNFYNSTFIRTSADLDLSTVILKYRPASADVPSQLSSNLNGVFYSGFRKDYFKIKTNRLNLIEPKIFIRHTGFDFGPFIGIGITPVNPTVTENKTIQEYDGIVFLKGFSVFATYESMSIGVAIGFDNLLDQNKNIWIYNNKPWIGLVLGIANF